MDGAVLAGLGSGVSKWSVLGFGLSQAGSLALTSLFLRDGLLL